MDHWKIVMITIKFIQINQMLALNDQLAVNMLLNIHKTLT